MRSSEAFRELDREVKVYCLKAEMPTILERLDARGATIAEDGWVVRKARACVDSHRDPHFGEPIETDGITAADVAQEILTRLGHSATTA